MARDVQLRKIFPSLIRKKITKTHDKVSYKIFLTKQKERNSR